MIDKVVKWANGFKKKFPTREFRPIVMNTDGKSVLITRYLRPIKPPEELIDNGESSFETAVKNFFFFILLFNVLLISSHSSYANDFVILPGDILNINVWKEEGMDQETLVLPDGTITFPLVGSMHVHDLTPRELQKIIKDKLAEKIPDASVTVSVKAPLGHTVSVM